MRLAANFGGDFLPAIFFGVVLVEPLDGEPPAAGSSPPTRGGSNTDPVSYGRLLAEALRAIRQFSLGEIQEPDTGRGPI